MFKHNSREILSRIGRVFRVMQVFVLLACVGLLSHGAPVMAAAATSCQLDFSPERVAAGQSCASQAGDFCPRKLQDLFVPVNEPLGCDGVEIQRLPISSSGGLSSNYIVLRGRETPQAIYLALHYLGTTNGGFVNVARLQELAKARRVLILVPQAPGDNFGLSATLGASWPGLETVQDVAPYIRFLDDVVADARKRFKLPSVPLYTAALSNGTSMVYYYACGAAARVEAIQTVAGVMSGNTLQTCRPSRPVGSVVVHGTLDPVNTYNGIPYITASAPQIHTLFESQDGCVGRDKQALIPVPNGISAEINYSAACKMGRRHFLVTMVNGSHTWPGQASLGVSVNGGPLDPRSSVFDATLQGYDLLRKASGR